MVAARSLPCLLQSLRSISLKCHDVDNGGVGVPQHCVSLVRVGVDAREAPFELLERCTFVRRRPPSAVRRAAIFDPCI